MDDTTATRIKGWDGTTPTVGQYDMAARNLIERALKSGEGDFLLDVKVLMDRCSWAESRA